MSTHAAVNRDKPHLWKADVRASVDFYNGWFLRFAPEAYREQRIQQTRIVEESLNRTDGLRKIGLDILRDHPSVLATLRMATAPPLARDRLIGLSYVTPSLVQSMEGAGGKTPRLPPKMDATQLAGELGRISAVIQRLADRDLFSWLDDGTDPSPADLHRAATVVADRLCGAAADPIIRNAQEKRQIATLRVWLEAHGYRHVTSASIRSVTEMTPGIFTFWYNVPVASGSKTVNITVDGLVMPHRGVPRSLPLFIEAKSAGDFTNTNKRRKEEAQKMHQLRQSYGSDVRLALFLCGYFDTPYLGYEAAEGIDWVWEHRPDDLALFGLDPDDGGRSGDGGGRPSPPTGNREPRVDYEPNVPESERRRLAFQILLDEAKTSQARNKLGQFATPPALADEMLEYARRHLGNTAPVRFLDPAFGTGSFYSAFLRAFDPARRGQASGFEIDAHYGDPARGLWADTPLDLRIDDFTQQAIPDEAGRFDLVVANPPYVRHHHMESAEKRRLGDASAQVTGVRPSGLTGLHAYFLFLTHAWMARGGLAGWLIPSEFMVVNYGAEVRRYLTDRVTLIRLHQFDTADAQFDDALVSSAVVWIRNAPAPPGHTVEVTHGGSLLAPVRTVHMPLADLRRRTRWNDLFEENAQPELGTVALGSLFTIRRGIATGANGFFVMTRTQAQERNLPVEFLKPVLPSPRYISDTVIERATDGYPQIDRDLVLLTCNLPESEVRERYPSLWAYLQTGVEQGISDRYLSRSRSPWYAQEQRVSAPILCSYMGRGSADSAPIRFFLNRSDALVTNVYLNLYPRESLRRAMQADPCLIESVWTSLDTLDSASIIQNGRTYGGGLHKMEPKELARVRLPDPSVLAHEPTLF